MRLQDRCKLCIRCIDLRSLRSERGNCETLHLCMCQFPISRCRSFLEGILSCSKLSDALVAGGCIRPTTLLAGLKHGAVSVKRLPVALPLKVSGLAMESFAWLQSLLFHRRIHTSFSHHAPHQCSDSAEESIRPGSNHQPRHRTAPLVTQVVRPSECIYGMIFDQLFDRFEVAWHPAFFEP